MIEGMGDEGEFEIVNEGDCDAEDIKFDQIVGTMQEVLMDESFTAMQQAFFNKNCM